MQSPFKSIPRIAITFNPDSKKGTHPIDEIMRNNGTETVKADYRFITPFAENLDDIYTNDAKLHGIFSEAKKRAIEFLKNIDGLILSGNRAMVDPRLYGQPLYNEKINIPRAIAELALIHVALQKGIPILGICGGLQILNVYLGGTLKALGKKSIIEEHYLNYNHVFLDPHSELAQIMRTNINDSDLRKTVFESHSQVLDNLGGTKRINHEDCFKVVAKNAINNNIEAIENQYGSPVMGLQFHPEVAIKGFTKATGFIYQAVADSVIIQNKKIFNAFKTSAETYHNKQLIAAQIHAFNKCDPVIAFPENRYMFQNANHGFLETNSKPVVEKTKLAKKVFKHTIGNAFRFFASKQQTHKVLKGIKEKETLRRHQMDFTRFTYRPSIPADYFNEIESSTHSYQP